MRLAPAESGREPVTGGESDSRAVSLRWKVLTEVERATTGRGRSFQHISRPMKISITSFASFALACLAVTALGVFDGLHDTLHLQFRLRRGAYYGNSLYRGELSDLMCSA